MVNTSESSRASTLGNRREHRRAELDVPVLFEAERGYQSARCRDISPGGLSVLSESSLAEGSVVGVYLELPSGAPIEGSARVVRRARGVLGLSFEALSSDAALALRVYCDRWRRSLLERCATRAASLSSSAPPAASASSAPPAASASSAPSARGSENERASELRIKAAPIIAVTADSKHRA